MDMEVDEADSNLLDVLKYLIEYLDSADLASLAAACTDTASLVRSQHAWKGACEREFGVVTDALAPKSFSRYKDLCKELKARRTPVTTVLAFAASVSSVDRSEKNGVFTAHSLGPVPFWLLLTGAPSGGRRSIAVPPALHAPDVSHAGPRHAAGPRRAPRERWRRRCATTLRRKSTSISVNAHTGEQQLPPQADASTPDEVHAPARRVPDLMASPCVCAKPAHNHRDASAWMAPF